MRAPTMNHEHRPVGVAVPVGRDNVPNGEAAPGAAHPGGPTTYHNPPIDIHEGPEGLVLEADLPGVADGDLSIQVEDNVLSLRARVTPPAPTDARVLHEEYRPGDFYRSFILSDEVDRGRVTAVLANGVLRLSLPKAERAKTRRIEIKTS